MKERDREFIQLAFNIAKNVKPVAGARLAALVVHRNSIVGIGYNHLKSHPFQSRYSKRKEAIFFHAEVHAIMNALRKIDKNDLRKTKLYVARARKILNTWEFGMCKPCPGCLRCIEEHNIPHIIFTGNGEAIHEGTSE